MADSPILTLIRTWAAVAWADGKIADAEGEALKRLIDGAELTAVMDRIARMMAGERYQRATTRVNESCMAFKAANKGVNSSLASSRTWVVRSPSRTRSAT